MQETSKSGNNRGRRRGPRGNSDQRNKSENRNNNRGQRPHRGSSQGEGKGLGQGGRKNRSGGGNGGRGRNYRGNRSGRRNGLTGIFRKYDNLYEAHLQARKKYFDLFDRADPKQKAKLERNFYQTIEQLRKFEQNLRPHEKEAFENKYGRPLDTTYSSNREISIEGDEVDFEGEFEDPHLLRSQMEADFSKDEEESVGTLEDYKALKGL